MKYKFRQFLKRELREANQHLLDHILTKRRWLLRLRVRKVEVS